MPNELEYLLQTDWRQDQLKKIGSENWITVYRIADTEEQKLGIYSALIPNARIQEVLKETDWDLSITDGAPGCTVWFEDEKEHVEYSHFTDSGAIQPLVLVRNFSNIRPSYIEILEEFKLFHNLYHDHQSNTYLKFSDNGDEDIIVRINGKWVEIRLKKIKQFLAFKEMHLAIYFDIDHYSEIAPETIEASIKDVDYNEHLIRYRFAIHDTRRLSKTKFKAFSRSHGKKLIPGMPKHMTGIWPYEIEKEFEEFIIGNDEHGNEILFSCDPDKLANYFGANSENPHYLTPVFFRRDVLAKYYNNVDKYAVNDGYITCKGLWSLRLDNNNSRYVIVYLGDLGRDLYHSEQKYWRSYNVIPEGEISGTAYKRGILAEWAEPEDPALLFKSHFETFQRDWFIKMNWHLFKPLSSADQHLYEALHVPLRNTQSEFDSQVMSLTRVIIDALNEENLRKLTEQSLKPEAKGIDKLEAYLELQAFPNYKQHIIFMRRLQSIRSISGAHRKGSKYEQEISKHGIDATKLTEGFLELLEQATAFLKALSDYYLS